MCRVIGSVAAEPVTLRHELLEAANPLIRPSEDSGWGTSVYRRAEGEEPHCWRFATAAPGDADLEAAVDARGRLFHAHARRATVGDLWKPLLASKGVDLLKLSTGLSALSGS